MQFYRSYMPYKGDRENFIMCAFFLTKSARVDAFQFHKQPFSFTQQRVKTLNFFVSVTDSFVKDKEVRRARYAAAGVQNNMLAEPAATGRLILQRPDIFCVSE